MSYYIRYVLTGEKGVTLSELEKALQQFNSAYTIEGDTLVFNDDEYGQIELNAVGDDIFEDDIELLMGFAAARENKDALMTILQVAKSRVTVQPIWQDRGKEATLKVLGPLFMAVY